MDPLNLLKHVLTNPGDAAALRALAALRGAPLDALDEDEELSFDEREVNAMLADPEWVAKVYDVLGAAAELSPEDERTVRTLFELQEQDAASVGKLFKNSLLRDLPKDLKDWKSLFAHLPDVSADAMAYLRAQPDVRDGISPELEPLLRKGITPMVVSDAAQAIRPVADRLTAQGQLPRDAFILTADAEDAEHLRDVIPPREVVMEIAAMADCPLATAEALFPWLVQLSVERSFLFTGFVAHPEADFIRLERLDGGQRGMGGFTLDEQWNPPDASNNTGDAVDNEPAEQRDGATQPQTVEERELVEV